MPTRIYKSDKPSKDCVTCESGIVRWETLTQPFMELCPQCKRPVHVAITPETSATLGSIDPRLGEPYRITQLPAGESGKDNIVSGPNSWRRAVEKAKRAGFTVHEGSAADAAVADNRSPREIKREERSNG